MNNLRDFIATKIITESSAESTVDLIYQKMLDVLDHAHIDYNENDIKFHLGRVVKNSSFDLEFCIRKTGNNSVRMGKNKSSGNWTIVVDCEENVPSRMEIDTFLSNDSKMTNQIKQMILKYVNEYRTGDEPSSRTKYEDETRDNENFEEVYEKIISELRCRLDDCEGTLKELNSNLDTENVSVRETTKLAIKNVAKEAFGDNLHEFKKVVREVVGNYDKGLTKENKERLHNRLESFYDQKIKPLFKS